MEVKSRRKKIQVESRRRETEIVGRWRLTAKREGRCRKMNIEVNL
jgi:hypothetical protein